MNKNIYTISAVSEKTGVPTVTLRAWERRYGLLKPKRTNAGHRLYSQVDIAKVLKIVHYIDKGIAVSKVRVLLDASNSNVEVEDNLDVWKQYLNSMVDAIEGFQQNKLDSIYNEILSLYPIETVTEHLLLPLLNVFHKRWQIKFKGSVAEERFFATFMRNKLGARFHHLITHVKGDKLLFACLPGQQNEFALLLFAIHVMNHGYEVVFLGQDTPVDDIFIAAERINAQAIVLDGFINERIAKQLTAATDKIQLPLFWHGKFSRQGKLPKLTKLTNHFSRNLDLIEQQLTERGENHVNNRNVI